MNDRLVVAFTVNNRTGYLAWVLESWREARGVKEAHLIFQCEPGCPEAVALCESVDFAAGVTVNVNERRLGVLGNPHRALSEAFAVTGFAALAEEDLIVSEDALEFLAWCRDRYRDDPQVLAVTTHQHYEQPGGLAGVMPQRFDQDPDPHLWVWGTWRDRWENCLRDDWDFDYRARGWDWRIRDYWLMTKRMRLIAPCLSRSQHIGRLGGAHCTPDQYETMRSRCFTAAAGPQEYAEAACSLPVRRPDLGG